MYRHDKGLSVYCQAGGVLMDFFQLGRRLAASRELADLTQQELAERAGVTQATIARIERGRIPGFRVETLVMVAEALGVSVDYLLGRKDTMATNRTMAEPLRSLRLSFRTVKLWPTPHYFRPFSCRFPYGSPNGSGSITRQRLPVHSGAIRVFLPSWRRRPDPSTLR